ncbi:hypothetical protein Q1695_009150 [Nippostrongylus brasiliensis]|nr:hypothetical protein Q1695_009150 [Nippostrongylus brasiliensis]
MSSQLRRSIGIARKYLLRVLQSCQEDIKSNFSELLPNISNEDLLDYAELHTTHHESIFTKLSQLQTLNKRWTDLMVNDPSEITAFHDFISKYGDYREEIQNAIDVLQQLDNNTIALQAELDKRGIACPPNILSTHSMPETIAIGPSEPPVSNIASPPRQQQLYSNATRPNAHPLLNSQETTKTWIALFTCLNTRAIYVDIALSLSTSCFLHILRRFIATNGKPRYLLSDNAPAFVATSETFPSTTPAATKDVIDYCSDHNIRFKFIAALAPWQGGVYERMVGIFKTSFKAAVRNRTLDLDEFVTLMKECEAIVNSRPITYVYSEIDSGYPLRPLDFLRPNSLVGSPRLSAENDNDDEWKPTDTARDALITQWNTTVTLLNHFWQRWNNEYLTNLRECFQNQHRQPFHTSSEDPFDGQVVLIHDNTRPRGQWQLGRIQTTQIIQLGNSEKRRISLFRHT